MLGAQHGRAAGDVCAHGGDVVASWSEGLVHQRAHPPRVVVGTILVGNGVMETGSFYCISCDEGSVNQYRQHDGNGEGGRKAPGRTRGPAGFDAVFPSQLRRA
jgi:hypothetical protein